MKQAMRDIDKILETSDKEDDHLNDVEKFYRSKSFIGSSMNISSLSKNLPRTDIKPPKHEISTKQMLTTDQQNGGRCLFSEYDKYAFTDEFILENRLKNKMIKKDEKKPINGKMLNIIQVKQK